VAINGAKNAAILAAQILGTADTALRQRIVDYKQQLEAVVLEKAANMPHER